MSLHPMSDRTLTVAIFVVALLGSISVMLALGGCAGRTVRLRRPAPPVVKLPIRF